MTVAPFDLIISHKDCPDGLVAAWVALKHSPQAKLIFASYDDAVPLDEASGKRVLVVDFCYDQPGTMLENTIALARVCSLTLLDHHKKPIDELGGCLPKGAEAIVLDKLRAGCRLAWDHLFQGQPTPMLVKYADDRDRWAWELLFSREVSAAFGTVNGDGLDGSERVVAVEMLDRVNHGLSRPDGFAEIVSDGQAILRYQARVVARAAAHAKPGRLGDVPVYCLNATTLTSETGEAIYKAHGGIACIWRGGSDGRVYHSLRSGKGGPDCNEVAKRYGGGGHVNAAGFSSDKLEVSF